MWDIIIILIILVMIEDSVCIYDSLFHDNTPYFHGMARSYKQKEHDGHIVGHNNHTSKQNIIAALLVLPLDVGSSDLPALVATLMRTSCRT